jgi:hypothetical protein
VATERFGFRTEERPGRAMALTLRCRSWRCRCCARRLVSRARARALMGARGEKVAFVTLTIDETDPRFLDARNRAGKRRPAEPGLSELTVETARYASWAFNRFRTYLVREHGKVPYFAGRELTKRGVLHIHLVVRVRDAAEFLELRTRLRGDEALRGKVRTGELSHRDRRAGLAIRAGFGLVVDAELARSADRVAWYVSKASGSVRLERPGEAVTPGAPRGDGSADLTSDGTFAAAYTSKGIVDRMPRYTRRSSWSISQQAAWAPGWVRPTRIEGFTWRLAPASAAVVTRALELSGFTLTDPATCRAAMAAGSAGRKDGSA